MGLKLQLKPRQPITLKPRKPIKPKAKSGCCGRGLSGGKTLVPKK